jgi:hypothetical protein
MILWTTRGQTVIDNLLNAVVQPYKYGHARIGIREKRFQDARLSKSGRKNQACMKEIREPLE